jgi:hypothetical protein
MVQPTVGVMHVDDRSIALEPGQTIRTGYVDVFSCTLACRERMAIGDIDRAYQKLLQLGTRSPWPCPHGHWSEDGARFVIVDGRHEWAASVALGRSHILVAWVEPAP